MRVVIADDEALARESLARMLSVEPDVEVAGQASNGLEALEIVEACKPDALFLDIEMPGLNGFEVLENLPRPPLVVFVTAYDEYAVKGFEANAIDYILKPLTADRVSRSVARLRDMLGREHVLSAEVLRRLMNDLRPSGPRRIAVRSGNRIVLVSPREIVQISAEEKLVFVHTAKDKYLVDRTVTEMESSLEKIGFFRINRGDIVNLDFVRELVPWFSGTWRVKLNTGTELDVSRERARQLKKLLDL